MRVTNPNNETSYIYVGKCKGNTAPKHVERDGISKVVKLDGKKATMFDSPKSKDYIYVKVGSDWMWIKDKGAFALDTLATIPVTRVAKAEAEPAKVSA